jgi:cyanophycinase
MSPHFALLGSGEFEPWTEPVDRLMLERSSNPGGPVLVLPTASAPEGDAVFDQWANLGLRHYTRLGIPAEAVPLKTRQDGANPDLVGLVASASMLYFSGGNPAYLARTLRDTPFWAAVLDAIEAGVGYAGCSAGVACLGERALDSSVEAFDELVWDWGLGLFPGCTFGPHWDMLDTYVPGLAALILAATPPDGLLFAIDERTAVHGDGSRWAVHGAGRARLHTAGAWTTFAAGESFEAPLLSPAGRIAGHAASPGER